LWADSAGVSLLEFAAILPAFLALLVGGAKFGIAMSQYIAVTNAAALAAQTFALSRGANTPYAAVTTAIGNAAPNLASGSITKTLIVNGGSPCTDDSTCKSQLTTAGAGTTASVQVSYPCDLTVLGVNFKPGGCTLSATSAQMVQ